MCVVFSTLRFCGCYALGLALHTTLKSLLGLVRDSEGSVSMSASFSGIGLGKSCEKEFTVGNGRGA